MPHRQPLRIAAILPPRFFMGASMTYSMTAFARQTGEFAWGSLVWEIRSVNHRYLEPSFKLPEVLRMLEGELREQLRTHVARGKIECSLRLAQNATANSQIAINTTLLEQIIAASTCVQEKLPQAAALNPLDLLAWPGVLQQADTDADAMTEAAAELFKGAMRQLVESRAREGAALRQFIAAQLDAVAAIVQTIRQQMPQLLLAQRQKLEARLAPILAEANAATELNQDRIEQEIVMLAQKSDVEEELDRLQTHIKETQRALQQREPCGRRLDFLMQEFNREANTLSSKSLTAETTLQAVQLKVLIEQMREQVQNIE
jgi:uncharacterized protein (TIGR00255 family)